MEWLFGRQKTPEEIVKENIRALRKSQREIDREVRIIKREELKLQSEIKKLAKQGQINSVHIMAREIVKTRDFICKLYRTKAQLQAISLHLVTTKSNASLFKSMVGATRAMSVMNRSLNLPALQRCVMEFEKQNDLMIMREDMMNDLLDDIDEDIDEEESDIIIDKILKEIGIEIASQLYGTPKNDLLEEILPEPIHDTTPKVALLTNLSGYSEDEDLLDRLQRLKNN